MMESLLTKMFTSQYELNNKINPNWLHDLTHHDFKTAIITEYAEFIESYDWKWWKKGHTNIENIKLELVDIIHFALSGLLLKIDINKIPDYLKTVDYTIYYNFPDEWRINYDDRKSFVYTNDKIFTNFISIYDKYFTEPQWYFSSVINILLDIIYTNNFTIDEIYKIYIAKNTLNIFRIENGYKEGKYKKIISNREDNDYIFDFIKTYSGDIEKLSDELTKYLKYIQMIDG